jgi:ABC-type proline/glycine betaine transport system ATPase subunit
MDYTIVIRSFLGDDEIVDLESVNNIEYSDDGFIVFIDEDEEIVGSFNQEYVKGFFKRMYPMRLTDEGKMIQVVKVTEKENLHKGLIMGASAAATALCAIYFTLTFLS